MREAAAVRQQGDPHNTKTAKMKGRPLSGRQLEAHSRKDREAAAEAAGDPNPSRDVLARCYAKRGATLVLPTAR